MDLVLGSALSSAEDLKPVCGSMPLFYESFRYEYTKRIIIPRMTEIEDTQLIDRILFECFSILE